MITTKIILFSTIIIFFLLIFKITKKYKYQNKLPGHIQELIPPYKPVIPYHPITFDNIRNPSNYLIPQKKPTNRPAIKWIVKQDPIRQY